MLAPPARRTDSRAPNGLHEPCRRARGGKEHLPRRRPAQRQHTHRHRGLGRAGGEDGQGQGWWGGLEQESPKGALLPPPPPLLLLCPTRAASLPTDIQATAGLTWPSLRCPLVFQKAREASGPRPKQLAPYRRRRRDSQRMADVQEQAFYREPYRSALRPTH